MARSIVLERFEAFVCHPCSSKRWQLRTNFLDMIFLIALLQEPQLYNPRTVTGIRVSDPPNKLIQ